MSPDMSNVMRPPTIAELFPGIETVMPNAAAVAMILADAKHLPGDVTFAFGAYVGDSPRDVVYESMGNIDPRVKGFLSAVMIGAEACALLVAAMRRGEISAGALGPRLHDALRRWLVSRRFENLYCGGKRGTLGNTTSIYGGKLCRTCGERLNHTLTCPEW